MSLNVSIIYFLVGSIIIIVPFVHDYKKTKKMTSWKILLIIFFVLFISLGIWDIINKYSDSYHDKTEIVNTIKKIDTTTGLKIDTANKFIISNANENRDRIIKAIPKISSNNNAVTLQQENRITVPIKKSEHDMISKFGLKNSTFNAPTQIGDRNIQNNNYGPKPRTLIKENLSFFFTTYPDINIRVKFNFINTPNSEGKSVKEQIIKILKNAGYQNIDENYYTEGVIPDPGPMINCFIRDGEDNVEFEIGSVR